LCFIAASSIVAGIFQLAIFVINISVGIFDIEYLVIEILPKQAVIEAQFIVKPVAKISEFIGFEFLRAEVRVTGKKQIGNLPRIEFALN